MAKQSPNPSYSGKALQPNWGKSNVGSITSKPGPGPSSKGSITPVRQAGSGHQSNGTKK
jgi:hypothetical protein